MTMQPRPPRRRPRRRFLTGATGAVLLLMVGFFLGVFVSDLKAGSSTTVQNSGTASASVTGTTAPANVALPQGVKFSSYWNIWNLIKTKYVGDKNVTDADLFYGSLQGMVASLHDPYSVFFDPTFAKQFNDELSGTFEGIGAEIGIKNDQLTVIAPLKGTPADKSGLKAGDQILAIDGTDTTNMGIDQAVSLIRGKKGTDVTLLVWHDGMAAPVKHVITRDTIQVQSVQWKMVKKNGKHYGVITISSFNETTSPKFSEAVQDLLLQDPDGIVLDLRDDPGGYLDAAVDVAGEWIPQDLVVEEKFNDGSTRKYTSHGTARFADIPTVVLVNGGTASAAEIVSGALQDHKKATVIGEQTFGKGSVQDYMQFDDGSALKLTVALWYTPNGRSINKEGITPDEVVKLTQDDFNKGRDPQMDRAFQILGGSPVHPTKAAATDNGSAK